METPPATPPKNELQQFAELFEKPAEPKGATGDATAPETAQPGSPAEKQKTGKPKTLAELAERLQLKPEDLYAVEVPMSDGKAVKLGALKDTAAKQDAFTVRELEFEESRVRRESDYVRSLGELRELVASLPPSAVKPEVLEAVRRKHDANVRMERARTLEIIPEWADEAKRTEELAGMVEHLAGYGFPSNFLESLVDHRAIRYVRENYLREKRLKRALEQVSHVRSSTAAPSKSNGQAPAKPRTEPTRRGFVDGRAEFAKIFQP